MSTTDVIKVLDLDMYDKKNVIVNAKQFDKSARYLLVNCYNQGQRVVFNSGFHAAYVRYRKSDGYGVFNACTVNQDGSITVELTEQMLASAGACYGDIVVVNNTVLATSGDIPIITSNGQIIQVNDGGIVSTMNFCVNVVPTPMNNSEIESSYEYDGLNDLIQRVMTDYTYVIEQSRSYAQSASQSASSASASASTATTKASEASSSASSASQSASSAFTSASNASTSEINARNSATSASNSATTATNKANEASQSATSASNSASTATTKASEASQSASSASSSASTATTKASEASQSASSASQSATTATTKASEASQSASFASTSASNASQSASSASSSASNASASESNAALSAKKAQSYAEGTTDYRQGEATNNAKYYYEQLARIIVDTDVGELLASMNFFQEEIYSKHYIKFLMDSNGNYITTSNGTRIAITDSLCNCGDEVSDLEQRLGTLENRVEELFNMMSNVYNQLFPYPNEEEEEITPEPEPNQSNENETT